MHRASVAVMSQGDKGREQLRKIIEMGSLGRSTFLKVEKLP